MTPSTTNTAARELLVSRARKAADALVNWRDEMPAVWYGNARLIEGATVIDNLLATLTQQQGGEQEAIAAVWHRARNAWMRQSRHGTQEQADAAAIEILTAALRSKQPAASEGDAVKFVRDLAENGLRYGLDPCHDWTSKETIFAFWRSYMSQADKSIRDRAAAVLASNTSKQAAGEAVAWGVVDKNDELWMCDFGLATIDKRNADGYAEWATQYRPETAPYQVIGLSRTTTPPRHPAEEVLIAAYDAGFAASGEGWNAEILPNVERRGSSYVNDRAEAIAALQAGSP